ncbi:MAG: [FeFe] hydrogenase H-cluster radical SAM maturase HydE [Candidatus Ratteibacteria bacterium]|nr:[FeFe] hydrogenase H-cluster radical SAM maturase HydE [Candidatus Ratteibacteria bacterium]
MAKGIFIFNKEKIIERLKDEPRPGAQRRGENVKSLFEEADNVRSTFSGEEVHIRGIIEFSNYCCRSCLYCGLRQENKKILRYRMSADEIVKVSNEIIHRGVKTVVLQSGDDFGYSQKMLSDIIRKIKSANPETAITLSLGERPFDDYKIFKNAGADRYLLKHETADFELYERLHPGQTLKKRIETLEYLKKLDYQTGAGNIVGLPGQTLEDLADDILLMKRLDVDMAGIGPFIPQKDTPLGSCSFGSLDLTLKVLALTRIVTENIHLPATTALATLSLKDGQILGLKAGANVIMPDFTPEGYRREYLIYDNKLRVNLERAEESIFKAGRLISKNRGDSLKCKRHQKAFACI